MALRFLLAFLFLALLVFCIPAQEQNQSRPESCPREFQCGNLGLLKFPFTKISQPDCGLCMAYCDQKGYAKIKLNQFSDQTFDAISRWNESNIKLRDVLLQRLLQEKSCSTLYYEINLPNSSDVSFRIVSNTTTLFRCSSYPPLSPEVVDRFVSNGYRNYSNCDGVRIFYTNPKDYPLQIDHTPPGCSAFHLPMRSWYSLSKKTELFELLGYDFDLQWYLKGPRKKRWKAIIIILPAVAGIAFLNVLAIFLIWRCKKRSQDARYHRSTPEVETGSAYLGISIFSYNELEEITNNFDASKELGDGGYGTVYYGKLRDGREVAVKRLYERNFNRMEQFMNEIQILTRLKHKNLVSLYGCTSRHSLELLLVYEYIRNGTVADHLHGDRAKNKSLTWPIRMKIAIETAGALAYLHASDTIHRDVKTNNILLDDNFQVKVADFGLSKLFPDDVSHISTAPQGTPGYVDPEYHHCYQLTDKSDVYSFGVVLIELISSMPAVDSSRKRHEINLASLAVNRIQRCSFHDLIDPSLGFESDFQVLRMTTSVAELAFQCLQLEKEMRPTMAEVLETLKSIQGWNEIFAETKETNANTTETRRTMLPFSPEPEDVVLLKRDKYIPLSPKSVTEICHSSSTRSSTSRSYT